MEYVVTLQPQVTRDDVPHHERLRVAHVQVAGWVREHVKHVPALRRTIIDGHEGLIGLPERLPSLLGGAGRRRPVRSRVGVSTWSVTFDPLHLLGHDVVSSPWLCMASAH